MVTVGIDEVGRGCWAGPLVAGAVILPTPINGLKDSKKLTRLQRERLALIISEEASAQGLGWVWPDEIDSHGLTWAVKTAMERAVAALTVEFEAMIIDGNINYLSYDPRAKAIIKADDLEPCVSAASVIAKVARDQYMHEQDLKYVGYGFASHVGYGTKQHIAALMELGVTELHRRSYKPVQALLS